MVDKHGIIYGDAKNLIKKHGTNDPNIILRERGVHLLPFTDKTKALGMYVVIKRNRFVFYNPDIDADYRKMVLAHELGHELYHQEEAKDGLQKYVLFHIKNDMEYEANLFASHLLLDEDEIIEYTKMGYDTVQTASALNVEVNLLLYKLYAMMRVVYNFNLS